MSMLQTASAWLNSQRGQYLSEAVSYIRLDGDGTAIALQATRGSSFFRMEDAYKITIRMRTADFIFSAADLDFEPVKGDEIRSRGHRYEVMSPDAENSYTSGEPVWRYCDPQETMIRIHTKDMGNV